MTASSDDLRELPTGELVKELSRDVSTLVRQELELAKAEMAEKGRKAGPAAGMLGGAGVAGLATLGALTAFLILVLDLVLPTWAAALIVTALWAAVAGVLALRGRQKAREVGKPMPEKTVDSVKEDVKWLKGRRKSERR
jgi:hypothetical protein